MLESASNVGIYGGNMMSAGGNITIINGEQCPFSYGGALLHDT